MLRLLAVAAVLAAFAVTYGVHYLHRESKRERVVASWGYKLIWDAMSATGEPQFSVSEAKSGQRDNLWLVRGQIALDNGGSIGPEQPFLAQVEQLCQSLSEQRCWRLNDLEIAGRKLSGIGAAALVPILSDSGQPSNGQLSSQDETAAETAEAMQVVREAEGDDKLSQPKLSSAITMVPLTPDVQEEATDNGAIQGSLNAPAAPTADVVRAALEAELETEEDTLRDEQVQAQMAALSEPTVAEPVSAEPAVITPEPAAPETAPVIDADESLVFLLQDRLQWLGYGDTEHLPHHGKLDEPTRKAIESYQRKNGLPEDGLPSRALLDHMERFVLRLRAIQQGGSSAPQAQTAVVKEDPGSVSFRMGVDAGHRGKVDQAIVHYTRAIESTTLPQRHLAYLLRGKAFAGKGNYRQAINDYSAAIRLAPGFAEAWINRGIAYAAMDSHDDAMADLQKGRSLDPDNAVAEQAMQELEQGSRLQ